MATAPATSLEELVVWQKSHALVLRVYEETPGFHKQELFGLVSQMRRAAASVPANICGGFQEAQRGLPYPRRETQWSEVDEIARMLGASARTLLNPPS